MKKQKHLAILSLVLAIVMSVFAACSTTPQGGGVKFSDRKYVRVQLSEISEILNQATQLSLDEANGEKVVNKLNAAAVLLTTNNTNYTLASIYADLDTTKTNWVNEGQYCYDVSQKGYKLLREAEKQIYVSPVAPYCVLTFGQKYIDDTLEEKLDSPEQEQLKAEENALASTYSSLYNEKNYAKLDKLYVDLIKVRKKIALAFGYQRFSDYAYATSFARDYTPDQAAVFIQAVKDKIVPMYQTANNLEFPNMSERLSESNLLSSLGSTIKGLGQSELTNVFNYFKDNKLYDFKVSSKKAKTSYVTNLASYNDAFMFLNASGNYEDLSTTIHEFGHFSAVMLTDSAKASNSGMNYDLAETHSQGLEVLSLPVLKKVLPAYMYKDYVNYTGASAVLVIVVQALFDEFEQFAYSLSDEQLEDPTIMQLIKDTYSRIMSILNKQTGTSSSFYHIIHFFAMPFYCISYSVSMVTALQFGYKTFADSSPIATYLKLLEYGESQPFTKTIQTVGLESPFESSTIDAAASYLQQLLNTATTPKTLAHAA